MATEVVDDLGQIGWVALLECRHTSEAMPKRQVSARCMIAMRRYIVTDIFHGGMPRLREYSGGEMIGVLRFYELAGAPWQENYSDDDALEHAFYYRADGSRVPLSHDRETELAVEHQLCEPLLESGVDQWLPTLEHDFYQALTALRWYQLSRASNGGRHKLYLNTYRRYAFLLTCRLRGLTNAQIAAVSGRHSDPQKARTRVGSDVRLARKKLTAWLALTPEQRAEALTQLQAERPQYVDEPLYCATVERELLWSRFSYAIQALNGQARPDEQVPQLPQLGAAYLREVAEQNRRIADNGRQAATW